MKLLSNSAIYFSGSVASKLLSLLSLPFLTAVLTPTEYGVIALLFMIGVFASSLLSLGLGTSIGEIYYTDRREMHRSSVITSGFYVVLSTHLLYCLLVFAFNGEISRMVYDVEEFAYVTLTMLLAQALQNVVFPLQMKIQFEERFGVAAAAMVLSSSLSVGLTLYLVVALGRGLDGYGEGMLLGALLQLLVYLLLSRIQPRAGVMVMAMRLIHKGWAMILSFIFLFVIQYGVRFPVEWFGGLEVLGLYMIGVSLAAPLGMITTAFVNAWTPYALGFSDRQFEAPEPLANATRIYVVAMGILVVLVFITAPLIATVLAAEKYYQSYYIIGLSALWHYFSSIFLLLLPPVYFACDVSKAVIRVQAFTVFVFLFVCIPLTMAFPLMGAAFAVAIGGLVLVCTQFYWNKKIKADQYVQIRYDKTTQFLIVLIPFAGLMVLMIDMLLQQYWLAVLAGLIVEGILLKILVNTPQVGIALEVLLVKFSKVR